MLALLFLLFVVVPVAELIILVRLGQELGVLPTLALVLGTGFLGAALDPVYNLLPDYTIPFISNELLSGILAVVVGTLVVFGIGWAVARMQAKSAA